MFRHQQNTGMPGMTGYPAQPPKKQRGFFVNCSILVLLFVGISVGLAYLGRPAMEFVALKGPDMALTLSHIPFLNEVTAYNNAVAGFNDWAFSLRQDPLISQTYKTPLLERAAGLIEGFNQIQPQVEKSFGNFLRTTTGKTSLGVLGLLIAGFFVSKKIGGFGKILPKLDTAHGFVSISLVVVAIVVAIGAYFMGTSEIWEGVEPLVPFVLGGLLMFVFWKQMWELLVKVFSVYMLVFFFNFTLNLFGVELSVMNQSKYLSLSASLAQELAGTWSITTKLIAFFIGLVITLVNLRQRFAKKPAAPPTAPPPPPTAPVVAAPPPPPPGAPHQKKGPFGLW